MTSFHYPKPEESPHWHTMSDEARKALAASAVDGAQELVGPAPYSSQETEMLSDLSEEVLDWAVPQLQERLRIWRNYSAELDVPGNLVDLQAGYPNFALALEQLHVAKRQIDDETGEELELALIPWEFFYTTQSEFPAGVHRLRRIQNSNSGEPLTVIDRLLEEVIRTNDPLYREPGSDPSFSLPARSYLLNRLARAGKWGVMLTQTGTSAGTDYDRWSNSDMLTDNGNEHYQVAGWDVDHMGIFEWLGLTFQKPLGAVYPPQQKASLLLANRVMYRNRAHQAIGHVDGQGVIYTDLEPSNSASTDNRPRYTVLGHEEEPVS